MPDQNTSTARQNNSPANLPAADVEAQRSAQAARRVVYRTTATAYAPNARSGGGKDRKDRELKTHTVQAYLRKLDAGKLTGSDYIAISMDGAFQDKKGSPLPYGTFIRIPQLEAYVNKVLRAGKTPVSLLRCRIVDSGGAFRNKGTSRIDVCFADEASAEAFGKRGGYTFFRLK